MEIKKKLLAGLILIGLLALTIGLGTYSYFSDTETSKDSTLQAGTIDLAVNGENPWDSAMFTFTDVKPCEDLPEFKINITNVGNNDGILTMSIDYVENDKAVDTDPDFEYAANVGDPDENYHPASNPSMEMTADHFANLTYIKALYYQYQCPATGYYGSKQDDLPSMVAYMDANGDGLVSVYEYKAAGIVPYDPTGAPFPATASICYFITLHLGDAFLPATDYHIDTTGTMWNVPQADGIDMTFTAVLEQVP